jgi:hypothetical protein
MPLNVLKLIKIGPKVAYWILQHFPFDTISYVLTGYSRKGDALLYKKLYTEAFNAYNSGLRMCPNDRVLAEKAEQAMRAIRAATESANSSNTRQSSSSPPSSLLNRVLGYFKATFLIVAIGYLFPFSKSFSWSCYRYRIKLIRYLLYNHYFPPLYSLFT